jgi:hypothetical protein
MGCGRDLYSPGKVLLWSVEEGLWKNSTPRELICYQMDLKKSKIASRYSPSAALLSRQNSSLCTKYPATHLCVCKYFAKLASAIMESSLSPIAA